jgi:hypothetical protein
MVNLITVTASYEFYMIYYMMIILKKKYWYHETILNALIFEILG